MSKKIFFLTLAVMFFCGFFSFAVAETFQDSESAAVVLAQKPIAYYEGSFSFDRNAYGEEQDSVSGKLRLTADGNCTYFEADNVVLLDVDAGDKPIVGIPANVEGVTRNYNLYVTAYTNLGDVNGDGADDFQAVIYAYFYKEFLSAGDIISPEFKFVIFNNEVIIPFEKPAGMEDDNFIIRYSVRGFMSTSYYHNGVGFYVYPDPSVMTEFTIENIATGDIIKSGVIYPAGKKPENEEETPTYITSFRMPGGVIVVPPSRDYVYYRGVVADGETVDEDGFHFYCKTFVYDARGYQAHINLGNNSTSILAVYYVDVNGRLQLIEVDTSDPDDEYDYPTVYVPRGMQRVIVSVYTSTPDQEFNISFSRNMY